MIKDPLVARQGTGTWAGAFTRTRDAPDSFYLRHSVIEHGTSPRYDDADVDVIRQCLRMCPSFSALASFLEADCSGRRGRAQGCTCIVCNVVDADGFWATALAANSLPGRADPWRFHFSPVVVVVVVVVKTSRSGRTIPSSRSRFVRGYL